MFVAAVDKSHTPLKLHWFNNCLGDDLSDCKQRTLHDFKSGHYFDFGLASKPNTSQYMHADIALKLPFSLSLYIHDIV